MDVLESILAFLSNTPPATILFFVGIALVVLGLVRKIPLGNDRELEIEPGFRRIALAIGLIFVAGAIVWLFVSPSTGIIEPTPTPTKTVVTATSVTATTIPTLTVVTETPVTPSPTPTPSPTLKVPVGLSTPVPTPSSRISFETLGRVRELARYEWDEAEWQEPQHLESIEYGSIVAFAPSNSYFLAAGSRQSRLRLYRPLTGAFDEELLGLGRITELAFAANNEYLYVSSNIYVQRWQISFDGTLFKQIDVTRNPARVSTLDLYGSRLILGQDQGDIVIREQDLTLLGMVEDAHDVDEMGQGTIWSLRFNEDGTLLVSGGADNLLRLWESKVSTLSQVQVWEPGAGGGAITSVAAHGVRESALFALGTLGGYIRVYEEGVQTAVVSWDSDKIGDDVWSLTFSPDGNILAAGTENGKVRLLVLANPSVVKTIEVFGSASINDPTVSSRINSLSFSSDGKLLAVGHARGVSIYGTGG